MPDKYDILLAKLDPTSGLPTGDPEVLEVFEDLGAPHPTLGGRTIAWQNCFIVTNQPHVEQ